AEALRYRRVMTETMNTTTTTTAPIAVRAIWADWLTLAVVINHGPAIRATPIKKNRMRIIYASLCSGRARGRGRIVQRDVEDAFFTVVGDQANLGALGDGLLAFVDTAGHVEQVGIGVAHGDAAGFVVDGKNRFADSAK